MPEKQFNITWVESQDQLPKIREVCPKCGEGTIYNSKYFEGVYCNACKWSYRISKWEKSGTDKKIALIKHNLSIEEQGHKEILEALREVYAKLLEIEAGIGKYLIDKEDK